jgi:hypothetical protein
MCVDCYHKMMNLNNWKDSLNQTFLWFFLIKINY